MHYRILCFLLLLFSDGMAQANHPAKLSSLPAYSLQYDPARDAFQDGRDAIELAKASQRHILIELGGDWCTWCHVLDQFLEDNPDIRQQLHATFVVLKVNVSDANDNAEFLAAFPRPPGYPHMYVADSHGTILLSKDTAELISHGRYSRQRFSEFFNQWSIPHVRQ